MLRNSFVLAFTFLGVAAQNSSQVSCYASLKGAQIEQISGDKPCGPTNSTSPFVSCCQTQDWCLENGMCKLSWDWSGSSGYYVGGCTDPTYSDPSCIKHCNEQAFPHAVYNTTKGKWACCNIDSAAGNAVECNIETSDVFSAPPPDLIRTVANPPLTTWTATSSPSAIPSTSSSSPTKTSDEASASASSRSSSSSTSSSTDTTRASTVTAGSPSPSGGASISIGAVIGITTTITGFCALALFAVLGWCIYRRRQRKRQAEHRREQDLIRKSWIAKSHAELAENVAMQEMHGKSRFHTRPQEIYDPRDFVHELPGGMGAELDGRRR